MPEISILLPTYNGAMFLERQLRSILDQSFQDIEVVICDDGSTDETTKIVESIQSDDSRLKLLPGEGNVGQRARLRQLVDATQTPLIAFSDQDDIWQTDKLARLRKALTGRSMAFGSSHLIDAEDRVLGSTIAERLGPPPASGDRLGYLFRPHVSAHAALIRREAVSALAFQRLAHFDWLMSLDAAFSDGIAFVPQAIVWHRIHGRNQANASFGDVRRWWAAFRPASVYGFLQRKRMLRFTFVSALEHLSFSPTLNAATRRDFSRVGALCRGAWFDPGISRPLSNPGLARSLVSALAPHAGSRTDLEAARRDIAALTRI